MALRNPGIYHHQALIGDPPVLRGSFRTTGHFTALQGTYSLEISPELDALLVVFTTIIPFRFRFASTAGTADWFSVAVRPGQRPVLLTGSQSRSGLDSDQYGGLPLCDDSLTLCPEAAWLESRHQDTRRLCKRGRSHSTVVCVLRVLRVFSTLGRNSREI